MSWSVFRNLLCSQWCLYFFKFHPHLFFFFLSLWLIVYFHLLKSTVCVLRIWLQEFRTCFPKMCCFGILIIVSCRHIWTGLPPDGISGKKTAANTRDEDTGWSLGWEYPGGGQTTHSNIPAWENAWTEEHKLRLQF